MQLYEAKKAADPEFYRGADSLLYGKDVQDTEAGIERMVAELNQQCVMGCPTLSLCIEDKLPSPAVHGWLNTLVQARRCDTCVTDMIADGLLSASCVLALAAIS